MRELVTAADAPAAIGPYSQGVRVGSLLFCSGALPLDPVENEIAGPALADEARQCLANLDAVCRAGGTALVHAVRLTVYTTRLDGFSEINEAFAKFFGSEPPARVTVGVAALPKAARVEIEAIVEIAATVEAARP